ncbi:MAG: OmpH family outer membrane protein [Caulobacteraceae bacterium]
MNARSLFLAGAAAGALALGPSVALAQTRHAAAPPMAQGPAIPGYCVFSTNELIGGSKVGQSVIARLKELSAQVNAELQPEAEQLRTEQHSLEGQANTLDAATYQARGANLRLRESNFEKKVQQRQQEMEATQNKEFNVVLQQATPILRSIYEQRHCSVLVDGDAGGVKILNPQMNITGEAVTSLNQKIQTLNFDREHLDTQPSGGAAGAAR